MAKKWRKGLKRVALVYPNRYGSGIANIGLQYIYAEINALKDYMCERFYWDVFGGTKSIETGTSLKEFDIALFSLQSEEDYFRAVKIINESGFSGLKVAGGPCVMENPKPLEGIFDVFVVGEIEGSEIIRRILEGDFYCEGVYTGKEKEIERIKPKKLEEHLANQIIGEGAYGKCILLEVGRGCRRRCKFCIVRQIYAPSRWRSIELLLEIAEEGKKYVKKAALIAPSATDHPRIKDAIAKLIEMGFLVSPSSMRADTIDEELMELLVKGGLKSITIAPEAGSERMRDSIRKGIGEEDVIRVVELAKERGIRKVKLYFMIGLPSETQGDVEEIIRLVKDIKKRVQRVAVSINPLVPKPHTPFQWMPYGGDFSKSVEDNLRTTDFKLKFLKKEFSKLGIEADIGNVESFAVQTILSRGDRKIGEMIKKGVLHPSMPEVKRYLGEIPVDAELPWDFIKHGYKKNRLVKEYEACKD
jgi:radical SAM superfamily enzyme YgiQ (UPF0313 family)